MSELPLRGRGTSDNPTNRFERLSYEPAPPDPDDDRPPPPTVVFRDRTHSLLTTNDSPDVGFDVSINPYRGCEHGCIYCYARPYHEYLGLSSGLDFETKLLVKEDAPRLLRKELNRPGWDPRPVGVSGVTDPYQPVERQFQITRRCLQVLADFRNPVCVVTKNRLVTRDADILSTLARHNAAAVCVSVTTLDPALARVMEPRASAPAARLEAVRELTAAGVPTTVLMAPIIPGLTDHEIPAVLAAARQAGAVSAGYVMLRLPFALKDLFAGWLRKHFPDRAGKVLGRVRAVRRGRLNTTDFGTRMTGEGPLADAVAQMFRLACRRQRFPGRAPLSCAAFRRPNETPRSLFGDDPDAV